MQLNNIKVYVDSFTLHSQLELAIKALNQELADAGRSDFYCTLNGLPSFGIFQRIIRHSPQTMLFIPTVSVEWHTTKIYSFEINISIQNSEFRKLNNKIVMSGIIRKFYVWPVVPKAGHDKVSGVEVTQELLTEKIVEMVYNYIAGCQQNIPLVEAAT